MQARCLIRARRGAACLGGGRGRGDGVPGCRQRVLLDPNTGVHLRHLCPCVRVVDTCF